MGYYTRYTLTWDAKNLEGKPNYPHNPKTPFCAQCGKPAVMIGPTEEIRAYLATNKEKFYGIDENGESEDAVKWYDWKEDMIAMSKVIKGVLFKLHGEGEETGDIWDAYFLDGKVQVHKAKVVIPEFDPKGWQSK